MSKRLGNCGQRRAWGWVWRVYDPTSRGCLCQRDADEERDEIAALQNVMR